MWYNNIMIITNVTTNIKDIIRDIWERNKSWCVISTDNCLDYEVKNYITKNDRVILMNDGECFKEHTPNKFIRYCQKYKILPIFLSDIDNLDFPHLMYSNIEEVLEDSFEYMHKSRDSKVYEEFLNLIGGFLW